MRIAHSAHFTRSDEGLAASPHDDFQETPTAAGNSPACDGGDADRPPAKTAIASTSISAASPSNTTPTQGTTSFDAAKLPLPSKNFGHVIEIKAHVLITYMTTVGMPVTNHT